MNVPLFVVAGSAAWMLAGVALASALGPRLRRCGELAGGAEDRLTSQPWAEAGGAGGRGRLARWTLPGSVAAFAFASSTGLAAAGVLPHPAQGVARSVLSSVRLEVPAAPDDGAPDVAVPGNGERPSSEASGSESSPPRSGGAQAEVAPGSPSASSSDGVEPAGGAETRVDDASGRAVGGGVGGTGTDEGPGTTEPEDPALPAAVVAPLRGGPATAPAPSERPAADPGTPAVGGAPALPEDPDDTGAPEGRPGVPGEERSAPTGSPAAPRSEDRPGAPELTPSRPDTPARHEPPPGTRPDRPAAPAGKPDTPAPPGPPPGAQPHSPAAPAGKPEPARPGPPAGKQPDPPADPGGRGRPAHAGPGAPDRAGRPQHPLGDDRSHPGRGRGLAETPGPAAAGVTPQTSLPEGTETDTAQLEG